MTAVSLYIICHVDALVPAFTGPVKIGIANDPKSRLATLQTGNPRPLALYWHFPMIDRPMAAGLEQYLHEQHKACRLAGEWFDLTPEEAHQSVMEFCAAAKRLIESGEFGDINGGGA